MNNKIDFIKIKNMKLTETHLQEKLDQQINLIQFSLKEFDK
jgi:hypothetical protein